MKLKSLVLITFLSIMTKITEAQSWLAGTGSLNVNPTTTKVGLGSTAPGARLTIGSGNVATTPTFLEGITWHDAGATSYGIFRTAGSWTSPNYQQLQINWSTGIILNPGSGYGKSFVDVQGDGLRVSSGNVYVGDYDAWSSNPPLKMSISFTGSAAADAQPALIVSKRVIGSPDIYRRILFVPHLTAGAYSYLPLDGDMGIIGQTPSNSGGIVIAASSASWAGIRITPTGNLGISTNLSANTNNYKLTVAAANTGTGSGILVQTTTGAAYSLKLETHDVLTKAFVIEDAGTENFKVYSTGKVYARAVTIQLTAFPDYVFNKEYKLKPLEEVENYICENGHLPEMPSAKVIEQDGANLGELVNLQMKKIEELTLYMIELKKENLELMNRIQKVENK